MTPGTLPIKKATGIERVNTPRRELEKLRQEQLEGDPDTREEILDAMLVCCGERGYRRVSVERVCRRYGGYRSQFYRYFANKAECYLAAYELESGRLSEKLLAPSESGCRDRLETALLGLADFAVKYPLKARGLFVEVHVAGGNALGRRWEVFERLSHALDSACRETGSRHSAPPTTAEFMISAVDQALSSALAAGRPEEFAEAVPELTALIHTAYRGEDALRQR
jgi:AcrR family transcriptional regulator